MHSFKEKNCITFQNLPEYMINVYIFFKSCVFKLPYIIKLSRYIKASFHVKSPPKS